MISWCLDEMVTCRDGLALLLRLRLVMNGVRLMAETKCVEREEDGIPGKQYDSMSSTPKRETELWKFVTKGKRDSTDPKSIDMP